MTRPKIAIVGMACMFPKAPDLRAYWREIIEGVDAVTEVPDSHWDADAYFDEEKKGDHVYARRGAFLDPVDFDPLAYGITPNALEATDTTQLLGLLVARQALSDAGYTQLDTVDKDRVSVILGVTGTLPLVIPLGARLGHPLWRQALRDAGVDDEIAEDVVQRISDGYVPWQEASFPGLLGNVVAGRIANRLDLHGTNCVVDAACASSLSALHLALMELESKRSDVVLSGGLDTFNDIFMYMCFSQTPALSPTGNARPFDASADGTILGEGLGIVALKRLEDAERDGDRIYAVIRGIGTSSDGKGNAIYAPSAPGQVRALRDAYASADVSPGTVELVEAHGTGTRVGDATEATALTEVYAGEREGRWCAVGSVKSQIGHTKAAAGAAGVIKAALSLYNKTLPPTIKVSEPNPALANTPFYVNAAKRPWIRGTHPRRAGVSAFGFGGSNFHCLLEEYDAAKPAAELDTVTIVALSGADEAELRSRLRALPENWSELRHAAAQTRRELDASAPKRLLIATTPETWRKQRTSAHWSAALGMYTGEGQAPGELAWLFPGQGAQYVGMLADLACHIPEAQSVLERADAAYVARTGERLVDSIWPHSAFDDETRRAQSDALRATNVAQPALGAVSAAAAAVLRAFGARPDACAGHSYGELPALASAGWITSDALFELSRTRGELMARGDGTMLACRMSRKSARSLLEAHDVAVRIANDNAPEQVVLSGPEPDIDHAERVLTEAGITTRRLDVAAAFHTQAVAGATPELARHLERVTLTPTATRVYSNTTAAPYPIDAAAAADLLSQQLAEPVEFRRMIERMHADGVRTFVEVGPGSRLSALVDRTLDDPTVATIAVDASSGKNDGRLDLARTLAFLAARGHQIELARWDAAPPQPQKKDTSRFTVPINGANYRSPQKPSRSEGPLGRAQGREAPRSEGLAKTLKEKKAEQMKDHHDDNGSAGPALTPDALSVLQQNLLALQKMQEQTAEVHRKFLETQEAAQQSWSTLLAALAGTPISAPVVTPAAQPIAAPAQPEPVATPVAPAPAPEPAPAPSTVQSNDVTAVLLEVVATKTGYPVDVLELDMDLDADLGIDSIKRVEILGALQEQLPELPRVEADELGRLHTLRQIADVLSGPGTRAPAAPRTNGSAPPAMDVSQLLLEIVATKTGYPMDVLELDMDLDADLGIDSIKRVEILGALTERVPDLPPVGADELGKLHTLGQIVERLHAPTTEPVAPAPRIEPAAESHGPLGTYRPVVVDTTLGEPLVLFAGEIWITHDGTDFTPALERSLTQAGLSVRVIDVREADTVDIPSHLGGLVIVSPALGVDHKFLSDALALSRRAAPALEQGLFATVSRLDGRFGVDGLPDDAEALSGALAGLSKSASHEWRAATCKAVDLDSALEAEVAAERVRSVLLHETPLEMGITAQAFHTVELREAPPASARPSWSADDVVVVTGGARGVTAACALELARSGARRFILLGRTPEPGDEDAAFAPFDDELSLRRAWIERGAALHEARENAARTMRAREIRRTLQALREAGAEAAYRPVDARDRAAVAKTLQGVSPAVIVHGAGVLADRLIRDKTREDFDRVFDTKVGGLLNVLDAVSREHLRHVILFSSTTARFGRKGQSDYAMANEALNKLAQQSGRFGDATVLSVHWGPWDGGMVTPELRDVFAAEGLALIGLSDGAHRLVELLGARARGERTVMAGGLPPSTRATEPVDQTVVLERVLDLDSHPVLGAHVVANQPVLPMALMIEWFGHAAMHENPGLTFAGVEDLRVLQGVRLGESSYAIRFTAGTLERRGDAAFVVPLTLWGDTQTRHATARVILRERRVAAPQPEPAVDGAPYPNLRLYDDVLFHGDALQVVRDVHQVSPHGIHARLQTAPAPSEWMRAPVRQRWLADPAALDGGFQSIILFTYAREGHVALPMHLQRFEQYDAFPNDGVDVRVRATIQGPIARADLDFVDADGRLVARIQGCECVLDEKLTQAFRDNVAFADRTRRGAHA